MELKFDYKKVQAGLLKILETVPSDAYGWNLDNIKSAISAGYYNFALDDLASVYLCSKSGVSSDILEIFCSLADQMDTASDPEWQSVAKIIDRDAKNNTITKI